MTNPAYVHGCVCKRVPGASAGADGQEPEMLCRTQLTGYYVLTRHAEHDTSPGQVDSVAARQTADLAEPKDWVEGIRAAARNARQEGNVSLAKALDLTRFEVYESSLDEEFTSNRARRLVGRGA